jgi:hypothetical protein
MHTRCRVRRLLPPAAYAASVHADKARATLVEHPHGRWASTCGLAACLLPACRMALLEQQPDHSDAADSHEEVSRLSEALESLESRLKAVETERDNFHRQVDELRMHSDESGQPSKVCGLQHTMQQTADAVLPPPRRRRACHPARACRRRSVAAHPRCETP